MSAVRLWFRRYVLLLAAIGFVVGCAPEKTPSRDHIPLIKAKLSKLQSAVREKNKAAIDSLLSIEILNYKQDSDSLLSFVYGSEERFTFELFGLPEILYTEKIAKVECYVMDSTRQPTRPITLTFIYDNELWLLSRFEVTLGPRDSL